MECPQSIIILRGAPGSGKSTIAKYLKKRSYMNIPWEIVSADEYFTTKTGQYRFDVTRLQDAHDWCFSQFCKFLDAGKNLILDNTNRQVSEYIRYIKVAAKIHIKPIVYHCVGRYTSTKNIPDKVINMHLTQFQVATPNLLKDLRISHDVDVDTDVRLLIGPDGYEFQLKNR